MIPEPCENLTLTRGDAVRIDTCHGPSFPDSGHTELKRLSRTPLRGGRDQRSVPYLRRFRSDSVVGTDVAGVLPVHA